MIRRPPRSTQGVSSAASDVYKRQILLNQMRVRMIHPTILDVCNTFSDLNRKFTIRNAGFYKGSFIIHLSYRNYYRGCASEKHFNKAPFLGSCLLYTSPSPRDLSTSRMPSSA
eukprot:TRINITY_DN17972_c0_g1_i1.p1 TRINITY_DN17972_c0_g1~~TRINITY_DN17972_c0_g1_i1.p1  ORF type:complete len:113 (-),score=15.95 TRINITY_DN17972_c0_g1_i1:68-406(-)